MEDDGALGAALKFALAAEGYAVELMTRAEDLLDRPFPAGAVCVLADHGLPGVSGLEALETLRARGVGAPMFLMTTQPGARLRARARAARVEILEKPILGGHLAAAIRAAIPI